MTCSHLFHIIVWRRSFLGLLQGVCAMMTNQKASQSLYVLKLFGCSFTESLLLWRCFCSCCCQFPHSAAGASSSGADCLKASRSALLLRLWTFLSTFLYLDNIYSVTTTCKIPMWYISVINTGTHPLLNEPFMNLSIYPSPSFHFRFFLILFSLNFPSAIYLFIHHSDSLLSKCINHHLSYQLVIPCPKQQSPLLER